jgi:hypothetical protein
MHHCNVLITIDMLLLLLRHCTGCLQVLLSGLPGGALEGTQARVQGSSGAAAAAAVNTSRFTAMLSMLLS